MIRLFHASDLHFGAADARALDWFAGQVAEDRPDLVILTGDITMRARRREFAAAQAWIAGLMAPVVIVPGNHDLPYFNPVMRFARPLARHHAMAGALQQAPMPPGLAVVPLITTAAFQWRLNWAKGRVDQRSLEQALGEVRAARQAGDFAIIAGHHPLVDADTSVTGATHGGPHALAALADAGANLVLTGHVHDPFDRHVETPGGMIRMIGAGTLSQRIRQSPPSFNTLEIATPDDVRLQVRLLA